MEAMETMAADLRWRRRGDNRDQTRQSGWHRQPLLSPLRASFLTHLFSLATVMTSQQQQCDRLGGGTTMVTRKCSFDSDEGATETQRRYPSRTSSPRVCPLSRERSAPQRLQI
ncbi:hypothetical protein AAHE18_11G103800 [Arachis hypogaea]